MIRYSKASVHIQATLYPRWQPSIQEVIVNLNDEWYFDCSCTRWKETVKATHVEWHMCSWTRSIRAIIVQDFHGFFHTFIWLKLPTFPVAYGCIILTRRWQSQEINWQPTSASVLVVLVAGSAHAVILWVQQPVLLRNTWTLTVVLRPFVAPSVATRETPFEAWGHISACTLRNVPRTYRLVYLGAVLKYLTVLGLHKDQC
jgi:hypothetical protein